jgi:hypothetical protein
MWIKVHLFLKLYEPRSLMLILFLCLQIYATFTATVCFTSLITIGEVIIAIFKLRKYWQINIFHWYIMYIEIKLRIVVLFASSWTFCYSLQGSVYRRENDRNLTQACFWNYPLLVTPSELEAISVWTEILSEKPCRLKYKSCNAVVFKLFELTTRVLLHRDELCDKSVCPHALLIFYGIQMLFLWTHLNNDVHI